MTETSSASIRQWLCLPRWQKQCEGHAAPAASPPLAQTRCPHPLSVPSAQKPSLSPIALVQMSSGCLGKDTPEIYTSIYNSMEHGPMNWDQIHLGMVVSVSCKVLTACSKPVLKNCKNSGFPQPGSWENYPKLTPKCRLDIKPLGLIATLTVQT